MAELWRDFSEGANNQGRFQKPLEDLKQSPDARQSVRGSDWHVGSEFVITIRLYLCGDIQNFPSTCGQVPTGRMM